MAQRNVLILERSSQNLQKITRNGKVMLEGVFAEFGIENRNGRIYEEKEYLPHLEYLKKDITTGNLLGELDHPERFEVALGNVSHRITELWYDQANRQIKGRIEIIEGTPKGQIAKSLLEAGVPLSISSRAAGSVNEDKTVAIQQIYTYDLVAKPGFESAQLHRINEGHSPHQAELKKMIQSLNESSSMRTSHSINSELGLVNENLSIIDLTDKYPQLKLRDEARRLLSETKNNQVNQMAEKNPNVTEVNEDVLQKWTVFFNKELSAINERLDQIQAGGDKKELAGIKRYVEKIRKIQEDSLNWQSEIAKGVNEVARYADRLGAKNNKHYKLTKKIVEAVDHNAKTLNATQDWTSEIAKTTNAIGETVDHNAKMLNGINEWTTDIARGVNKLNEWNTEKARAINKIHEWVSENAKAVNGIHEWTSSIAKNLNHSVNWTEEMFGRAISKEDAKKLVEYVELVNESKQNPALKNKIDEMLKTHSITKKALNENSLKALKVLDTVPKMSKSKINVDYDMEDGVEFDEKTKTIISKLRKVKVGNQKMPIGNTKLQMDPNKAAPKVGNDGLDGGPMKSKFNLRKHFAKPVDTSPGTGGSVGSYTSKQALKLDVKPTGKLKENVSLTDRKSKLDDKLSRIMMSLEKERSMTESVKNEYPFTQLLSESDRKRFAALSATDKQKVANEIAKVPTTDSNTLVKMWENALSTNKGNEEPLWLSLAPKAYRKAYDNANDIVKENIKAKSEFYNLSTQYQIDNFWETSGILSRPTYALNESITAKTPEESEQKLDTFVAGIGEMMKARYSN